MPPSSGLNYDHGRQTDWAHETHRLDFMRRALLALLFVLAIPLPAAESGTTILIPTLYIVGGAFGLVVVVIRRAHEPASSSTIYAS